MTGKNPEVFGTVTGIGPDGALTVTLDSGERGLVDFSEISRQENTRLEHLNRMIGRHMGFMPGKTDAEGRIALSARAYEEQEYRRICDAFHSQTRNIYTGTLISVTADGKLAFFRIAQGVTGALHVSSFCLSRVYSFRDVELPRQLTVAVIGVNNRGWLNLSAKPAFGDFEYSLNQLSLSEGETACGIVAHITADGAAAIMLAPNLTVLTDACCRVYPGDWVRVRIRRIDRVQHKVKAQMLERTEPVGRRFDYTAWNQSADLLDAYIDQTAFDERIRLQRPAPSSAALPDEAAAISLDFSVSASRSPFSTYRNEQIIREPHRPSRIQDICFESRMGYLSEKHIRVADAIEALKYSSSWQLRRYLYLKDQLTLSERELKNVIDRLIKHDVVGVLRFRSDEGSLLTRVLHPSLNYRALCGRNPRNFGPRDFAETDASGVKTRLASNQLLIGLMHGWNGIEELETHPFLLDQDSDVRVRPRHTLLREGRKYYLEAVRQGWEDEFVRKLRRYETLFGKKREAAEVLVVLESASQVQPMAERISELRLSFPVSLTDDLSCLPQPSFTPVAAASSLTGDVSSAAKALLQRIRQKIEDF